MRVTITKPNTPDDYGRPQAVGAIITVPDDYGSFLVRALLANDTDGTLSVNPNDPNSRGRIFNTPSQVSGGGGIGVITSTTYNASGQITASTIDGTSYVFTYNTAGRIATMQVGSTTYTYAYNANGTINTVS